MLKLERLVTTEFKTAERTVTFNTDCITGIVTVHEDLEGEVNTIVLTIAEILAVALGLSEKQRVSETFDLPFADLA